MEDYLDLVVIALAVTRVTAAVTRDEITSRRREAARGRHLEAEHGSRGWVVLWLWTCARCLGFWVAVLWTIAWGLAPDEAVGVAIPFAVAQAAYLLRGDEDEDE